MACFKVPSKYVYPKDMCELIRELTNVIEKKKIEDVDRKKLWDITNNMYDQWVKVAESEKEKDKKDYFKLISFLTLLLSTNWFTEEQEEIEFIINEIYYNYIGVDESFPEDEITRAIENSLGAEVKKCIINKNALTVEFIKGDYGEGVFDGKLVLDINDGLFLHTQKEILQYTGKLPVDSYEIELAINSYNWKQYEQK
ncbi:hypothetical protein MKS88_002781 [Plasmodium brasilianum]|uniref:Uncharacterized protein n=2 Tax=Plasmodium (Plasmodium) TaxID=418103 RepID=A0A1D3PBQ7_PLAMA|nr:conserved Plasmodium protein, unknown function [Plasmodium malariae]KAI4838307.1 hypothetical protein MKS88_002781 [Plasmodium brasilianum]SCN12700.1 conserved Plasmodium protein, unknown function [Plasmodium malariae]